MIISRDSLASGTSALSGVILNPLTLIHELYREATSTMAIVSQRYFYIYSRWT